MKHAKTGIYLLLVLIATLIPISSSAAESFYNEAQAAALNHLGLYNGISNTSFNPDLGASLNRETGVVMLLRLLGLQDDALAMTDAQANTILLKFTDAARISSWAKKSVAYAVQNGLVFGFPDGTFAPQANLVGEAYCSLILRQLGYTPNYDTAAAELANAGGLTSAQAMRFSNKALIKDDLVGISYGVLSAKDTRGESVLVKLVANKVVDAGAVADTALMVTEVARVAAEAVAAYEAAPITTLDQITAAEALGITASKTVALIADANTKAGLESRIKARKEKVDTARKNLQDPKSSTTTLTLTVVPKPYEESSSSSHTHSIPSMSGTVAITGTEKYGSTLTADPAALLNSGTPTYQWNRGGTAIGGATASTYTLAAADTGAVITVTATADGAAGTGSITSAPTTAIAKADGPAPPVPPTEASKTDTSITLAVYDLVQFSIDAGVTWQDSETFTGLTSSTTYTFVARVKETATTNASAASAGTTITTTAPISSVVATCSSPATGEPGTDATVDGAAGYIHTSTVWTGRLGTTYIAGETPEAVITLTAKAGYIFAADLSATDILVDGGTVTYEAGQGVQGGGTSVIFTVTYPQLLI
ncbi:MAG: S-layer homology domain-containing protein [Syntrophomonadaceae bacterium]|nr:S-layer homology domain-containing protein [Syntrophomonadaceae bacterium]